MKSAFLGLITLAGCSVGGLAFAGPVERVIDGDDLCLCGDDAFVRRFAGRSRECSPGCVRVRLCGIDAPERGEGGYDEATRELKRLTTGNVHCTAVRKRTVNSRTPCDNRSNRFDRDRVVAQCLADDRDIAQDMVDSDHACDWTKYSGGHYSRNGGRPCPDGHRGRRRAK